jgi:hypothetical protein
MVTLYWIYHCLDIIMVPLLLVTPLTFTVGVLVKFPRKTDASGLYCFISESYDIMMTRVYSISTRNRQYVRNFTDAVQSATPFLLACWCRSPGRRRLMRGSSVVRLLGFRVWIPPGHGCLSLESVICCQVEVCMTGWSPMQTSPTECGACECDH